MYLHCRLRISMKKDNSFNDNRQRMIYRNAIFTMHRKYQYYHNSSLYKSQVSRTRVAYKHFEQVHIVRRSNTVWDIIGGKIYFML